MWERTVAVLCRCVASVWRRWHTYTTRKKVSVWFHLTGQSAKFVLRYVCTSRGMSSVRMHMWCRPFGNIYWRDVVSILITTTGCVLRWPLEMTSCQRKRLVLTTSMHSIASILCKEQSKISRLDLDGQFCCPFPYLTQCNWTICLYYVWCLNCSRVALYS